jgi:hypothetical protein
MVCRVGLTRVAGSCIMWYETSTWKTIGESDCGKTAPRNALYPMQVPFPVDDSEHHQPTHRTPHGRVWRLQEEEVIEWQ